MTRKVGQPAKTERNNKVVDFAFTNTNKSLAEIGKVFGISRQRVWKILEKWG